MTEVAIFILTRFAIVAEVVGFVNNNQIKILPIEILQIDTARITAISG